MWGALGVGVLPDGSLAFPPGTTMRAVGIGYLLQRLRAGRTVGQAAADLGISRRTAQAWRRAARGLVAGGVLARDPWADVLGGVR